jgi:hypothetical protein
MDEYQPSPLKIATDVAGLGRFLGLAPVLIR